MRDWVYIQSGYTWALWTSGLPLLAAVLALLVVAARTGYRSASSREPVAAAIGITVVAVACMLAGTLFFDPHLTMRCGAELFFVLLGMCAALDRRRKGGDPRPVADERFEGWTCGAAEP